MSKIEDIDRWLTSHNLVDEFHTAIQRPDAYVRITTGISGWVWEDELKKKCQLQNWSCEDPHGKGLPFDLRINDLKAQCKSTTYTKRVDIRSKKKANKRRYVVGDFDILALRILSPQGNSHYFVPAEELVEQNDLLRPGFKLSDYRSFEDKWGLLTST